MKIDIGNLPDVEISKIIIKCKTCKKEWRVIVENKELNELPIGRFVCENCNKLENNK
jgi:hypothetical protein